MTEMADRGRPVELPDVPPGEEISPADVAERVDEDPAEQENREDPVWSGTRGDETTGEQGHESTAGDR
jgi:hypothetical protein